MELQLNRDALERYAEAEKRLRNPIIAAAVVGVAPIRDERLPATYTGAGMNVNIPVLNGGLFKARREEAESRAAAGSKDVQNLVIQIGRDVRIAWFDANDAFRRLESGNRSRRRANREQARLGIALQHGFQVAFHRMLGSYEILILRALRVPTTLLIVFFLAFGASLLLYTRLGFSYFPQTDAGQFVITFKAPSGTKLTVAKKEVARLESLVKGIVKPEDLAIIVDNIGHTLTVNIRQVCE